MADKPTLAELKAQHGAALETMAVGLFRPNRHQFFEARELSAELISEFCASSEVLAASLDYASKLEALWAARYPDAAGLKRLPAPRVELLELPVFDQPAAPPLRPGQIPAVGATAPTPPPDMKTHFNLPNCRRGVTYSAAISGADAAGVPLVVTSIEMPPELGLHFDPLTQMVTGTPASDGEFTLALQWRYADDAAPSAGTCHLIANPDPRSLWKVLEPAPGQKYARPHLDAQVLPAGAQRLLAASRRGRSHEHGGTFRDDDFFLDHEAASGWSVMLVADGAGSAGYSREGARLAVHSAGAYIVGQLRGEFGASLAPYIRAWEASGAQDAGGQFHALFQSAATVAVQAIEEEAQDAGAAVKDFATTLLAVATRREGEHTFIASFWMGDGAIAAYGPRGTVKLMGTPDSGEFAGQTRFLDRAAINDAGFARRVGIGRFADISAVMVMTDGVSDPFFETDNGLQDAARWDTLWDELAPPLASAAPDAALLDWLHFFRQGHHDDRTIAILW